MMNRIFHFFQKLVVEVNKMKVKKTKFACLVEKQKAVIRERALPEELEKDEILIKHLACNICTSDYGQWLGLREHQGYPMASGHEASGIIIEVGSDVRSVKVGDHVMFSHSGNCGACEACREGRVMECTSDSGNKPNKDGYYGPFGLSEYSVKKAKEVLWMNPELDPSQGGFMEPLSTVVYGLKKLRIQPFETVVVIGGGTMGLLNAMTAKAHACRVIVTEIMQKKIDTAREMGLEVIDLNRQDPVEAVKSMTGNKGADAVIVAVGNTKANTQAIQMLKKYDGRILYFAAGYPAPSIGIDSNAIHYKRAELYGTFGANLGECNEAARLLNSGIVDVSKLIEPKKYNLDDVQDAFKAASTPGMFRVSVVMD